MLRGYQGGHKRAARGPPPLAPLIQRPRIERLGRIDVGPFGVCEQMRIYKTSGVVELRPRREGPRHRLDLGRAPVCPGRKPPKRAVKRPARPYKSPIQNGLFIAKR